MKKVFRPKIKKKPKKKLKGGGLAQAFSAAKPKQVDAPIPLPKWMQGDEIPMEFFRNGRPRPRATQCTCKRAPNKYCWVHKKWAARPDIAPSEDVVVDLWAAWEEGKVLPELL